MPVPVTISTLPAATALGAADVVAGVQSSVTKKFPGSLWLPTAWTAPSFLNSWVNFGAPYQVAGYRKEFFDLVRIRGLVKNGTINADIFVLPVGFRPPNDLIFASDVATTAHTQLVIQADGSVLVTIGTNTSASINCVFSVTA